MLDTLAPQIGRHVYARCNPFTARDKVQARCPSGWRAFVHLRPGHDLPAGAVQVGRVQNRPGEPEFPLYVMQERKP